MFLKIHKTFKLIGHVGKLLIHLLMGVFIFSTIIAYVVWFQIVNMTLESKVKVKYLLRFECLITRTPLICLVEDIHIWYTVAYGV